MADSEIPDLTAASTLQGDELINVVQDGNSRQTTVDDVRGGGFVGVRVKRTSDQTTANYTTQAAIPWQDVVIDTDSFWSAGAPGRITIPAVHNGKYANVSVSAEITNTTADAFIRIFVRQRSSADATKYAAGDVSEFTSTTYYASACLIGVPIATGDYFEALLLIETDSSVTVTAALCGMALQVIG